MDDLETGEVVCRALARTFLPVTMLLIVPMLLLVLVVLFLVVVPLVMVLLLVLVMLPHLRVMLVIDGAQQSTVVRLAAHAMVALFAALFLAVATALAGIAAVVD